MSVATRRGTSKQRFIGGEWGELDGGRTFADRDPLNGDLVAEVAAGGPRLRAPRRDRRRGRVQRAGVGHRTGWLPSPPVPMRPGIGAEMAGSAARPVAR
jgi:hypothetical protein